jgi:uncharacterized protein
MDQYCRDRLMAIAASFLSRATGCHRTDHTQRVVHNALWLAESTPEVNRQELEAAAWLHDIGRGVEREQGIDHAHASAALAAELLPQLGFAADAVARICDAIAAHRFSAGIVPTTPEGRLLQDADRLDALGAIGMARTFVEGGAMRELYHVEDPFAEARTPDDDAYSLDHFFTKLLRLPATMHTPAARTEAERRVAWMEAFLAELKAEIAGPATPPAV